MKLFIKFLALVVVLALAGPFFIKGPDGQPLWSWQQTLEAVKRAPGNAVKQTIPGASEVDVYRWQDADGQWHYSGEPPEGIQTELLKVDPRTNMVGTAPVVVEETAEAVIEEETIDPHAMHVAPALPVPDPTAVKELMGDIDKIQQQADQRLKALENID
ncbi:MAG: DUF4124 domain-containing protein [Pseudomonadota bacterium]